MAKCKYTITLSDGSLLEIPTDFDQNNEVNLKKSLMTWLLNSSDDYINKVLVKDETVIPDKYKQFAVKKTSLQNVVFSGESNKFLNTIKNNFPEILSEENIIFTENYNKDFEYDKEANLVLINSPEFDDENFLKGILNKLLIDYNDFQNKNLKVTDGDFLSYIGASDFFEFVDSLYWFDQEVFEEPKENFTEQISKNIYSKLGNKTQSENVVIKPWSELKYAKNAVTSNDVTATRIPNSNEHFDNPFSIDSNIENLEYKIAIKEANSRPATTNIPQNLQSGVKQYGTLQYANKEAIDKFGKNVTSIEMIEAGLRTRTTRTDKELEKYNIKVGSYIKMFGKDQHGTTKNVIVKITKITKGYDEANWYKEGWTLEGLKDVKDHTNTANAIEFEVIHPTIEDKTQGLIKTETVKEAVEKYIDWVINSKDSRAEWIREQIKSGELKGKPILTNEELGEPSHATALDYLINNWSNIQNKKFEESKQENSLEENIVVKPKEIQETFVPKTETIALISNFSRGFVQSDNNYIYLFTDNARRSSGWNKIDSNSWYAKKYGLNKNYPGMTQAVIRGLDNAYPITTMVDDNRTQWNDNQFDEYKNIIDDEINEIKRALNSGKFLGIKFAAQMPFGEGKISNMKQIAPKIFEYMTLKLKEIGIDNTGNFPKAIEIISQEKQLINPIDIVPKTESKPEQEKIQGENITSKGSEFAKKLTNVGNNVGLIYKGKQYINSEHAYQTWKSGEFNQQGYDLNGSKVRNGKIGDTFSIMTDILTEKLKQHPELIKGINERGGLEYLQKSTHNVIGDKFWETSGQNKFIEALIQAYQNVTQKSIQETLIPKTESKPQIIDLTNKTEGENFVLFKDGIKINTGNINLNVQQLKALQDLADFSNESFKPGNQTFGLKGYAGTGKTTLINLYLKYLAKKSPSKTIRISSPTNRANAVMRQKGIKNVSTLHSLFGLSPEVDLEEFDVRTAKFVKNKAEDTLERGDTLIIDESSMINNELYKFIKTKAAELNVKVIFTGDGSQLKPVGQSELSKAFTDNDKSIELTIVERTGDNPLLKESTNLRTKSNAGNFSFKTNIQKGEGIVFTNNSANFIEEASNLYASEEFAENPLLLRIVSATNADVININNRIRKNIWGENESNEYNVGEILMGYSNFDKTPKGEYKIYNGGDYQVIEVNPTTKELIPGVKYNGFNLTVRDLISGLTENIFMLSKNTSQNALELLGQNFENLRLKAINTPFGPAQRKAWVDFFNFGKKFTTPVAISYLGAHKISPTLQYGYAHTIHKSQGGTYTYSFVLGNSIDIGFNRDTEQQNQLRYVAITRAEKAAIVLTNKGDVSEIPSLDIISKEDLSKINKKYGTSYTIEDFKKLSKDEQENILNCL